MTTIPRRDDAVRSADHRSELDPEIQDAPPSHPRCATKRSGRRNLTTASLPCRWPRTFPAWRPSTSVLRAPPDL